MTLAPLFATPLIALHALAAFLAVGIGAAQLVLPKGTLPHRALGRAWVLLMAFVATSSFFVHTICMIGGFSPIHILSVLTLASLPVAVLRARRGQIAAHARGMRTLYVLALIVPGLFTLLPGRIMHDVVFGTSLAAGVCAP